MLACKIKRAQDEFRRGVVISPHSQTEFCKTSVTALVYTREVAETFRQPTQGETLKIENRLYFHFR